MAPSATTTPNVPSSANVEKYGETQPPPANEVKYAIQDEDESVHDLFSLKGGSVIITGGGRGLGCTIAGAAIEAGADVYCCDILESPSQLEWKALQSKAAKYGCVAQYHRLNIIDVQAVNDTFQEIAAKSKGPITGFVGCAATMDEQYAMDYDMDKFRKLIQVNVDGAMITAQAVARLMRDSGKGGSIVLMASISGSIANRGLYCSAYNTSKAACHQLCRSTAVEWGQYKIRVNTISPGYIRTAMTNMLLQDKKDLLDRWENDNPLGRIAMPSELKGPALYLLSKASSFVTGSDIRVDGGVSCVGIKSALCLKGQLTRSYPTTALRLVNNAPSESIICT